MTRPPSILDRVIGASVERLVQTLNVPPAAQPAFRDTAHSVLHGQWASMFGGETVRIRFYASKENQRQRDERRQRIVAALRNGESTRAIARRQGCSQRWVEKVAVANRAGMESSRPA